MKLDETRGMQVVPDGVSTKPPPRTAALDGRVTTVIPLGAFAHGDQNRLWVALADALLARETRRRSSRHSAPGTGRQRLHDEAEPARKRG